LIKPSEKSDTPKIQGTEKITILSTKIERREISRTSDGDLITKELPPRKFAQEFRASSPSSIGSTSKPKILTSERAKNSIRTHVNNINY